MNVLEKQGSQTLQHTRAKLKSWTNSRNVFFCVEKEKYLSKIIKQTAETVSEIRLSRKIPHRILESQCGECSVFDWAVGTNDFSIMKYKKWFHLKVI